MAGEFCDVVHPRGYRCAKPKGHEGNHEVRRDHHCHARGCGVATKPEMLMCLRHWRMVPRDIQRRVWATYRPGQCDDMRPSEAWHEAADAAIRAVAEKEAAQEVPRG
jgi:hypothetical protein